MANSQRLQLDENYTYTAKLPDMSTTVGLYAGFLYGMLSPKMLKYPMRMGVIKFMPRGLLIGGSMGYAVDYMTVTYKRRRLAFAEEYKAKHPEDFEEPVQQKFECLLLPWNPSR